MSFPELINLSSLIDDARCFELIRQHRWPEGTRCPHWGGPVNRDGHDDARPHRQCYRCQGCGGHFDDLTGTILAGRHQPLRIWVLCLYFMGLNLSNRQIAGELGLNEDDVQAMTEQLRQGLTGAMDEPLPDGVVEIDEVYVTAGHKRHPAAVEKRGAPDGAGASRARGDAAPWTRRSRRSPA